MPSSTAPRSLPDAVSTIGSPAAVARRALAPITTADPTRNARRPSAAMACFLRRFSCRHHRPVGVTWSICPQRGSASLRTRTGKTWILGTGPSIHAFGPRPREIHWLTSGPTKRRVMLSEETNRLVTQVGPGTKMGALLRRYWHPIAAVAELDDTPVKPMRLFGEDLVLYRDLGGTYGLVGRHCPHR